MSIIKRNDVLFPSLLNEILKPDWFGGIENYKSNVPAVNIKENEKDFELELTVPGRNKEDFNIEVNENVLTISSKTKIRENTEKENYTRKEFTYTAFKRAFTLPETIDEDSIKATYVNGILKFTLPKNEESLPKPKRLIALS
ncbi:MAG: Hsp20/alpha crystallin family protein [Maribacter sp.]|nr:Hsp20/alpha crystallin family protein [Maribacter sp.]